MRIQGKKKKGFTLIELIIVFAILAIIAAIAIPNFTAMRKKSTVKADVETAKQIINAVDTLVTEGEISVDAAITNLSVTADGTTGDGATIVKYLKGKIPEVQSAAKDTRFILNVDAGGLNTTVTFKPVPKPSKVPDGTTMDANGMVYVK